VYALNESPITQGLLWAGSDDGLIHVSRDAGAHWENVTPRNFGRFTRTAVIEPSHFDPGTMLCKAGDASDCLSEGQVTTLRKIYGGPKNPRTGKQIFPGWTRRTIHNVAFSRFRYKSESG